MKGKTVQNLFDSPGNAQGEFMEELASGGAFRLVRIVSSGQATPEGQWYDQPDHEWVVLLSGSATLRFDGEELAVPLRPGDYLCIPAHCRHRVEATDPQQASVWLALHYLDGDGPRAVARLL